MEKTFFSFEKIYEYSNLVTSWKDFEISFLESIKNKEKQDLIGYLITTLPVIIFTNFRAFSREELKFKNTIDDSLYELCNLRINLKLVYEKLIELETNASVEVCRYELIISELYLFSSQYLFTQLSKSIYATEIMNREFLFDIKKNSILFQKFSNNDDSSLSIEKSVAQKYFIQGYNETFENLEEKERKKIETELIYMTNTINQKKRLKSIFDKNICFSNNITETKKSKLLIYFFKNVTCKFFFKYLDKNQIEDYEVNEAFRTFRKRI